MIKIHHSPEKIHVFAAVLQDRPRTQEIGESQQITTEVNKNKTQTEEKMSEGNDFDPATIFRKAAPIAANGVKIQRNSLASWAENMKCTCNLIDEDSCAVNWLEHKCHTM